MAALTEPVAHPARRDGDAPSDGPVSRSRRRARLLSVHRTPPAERHLLAIIVVVGLAAYALAARMRLLHGAPWGDEPAYLVLSQSIQLYHSLDVAQVYANADYLSFYPAHLDPHVVTGADGRVLTLHQFGGPLLWLVPFVLWGRAGAVGFIVVVSVLCLVNIYYFLRERRIEPFYAFVVTLCLAIGSPIYVFASMSFVEPIGALAVLFAVRAVLSERLGPVRVVVASAGVALLPWVHMRFAPLAVSLGVLLIWRVSRDHGRGSVWPYVQCIAPLAVSAVLIEIFTLSAYGETDPMAPQAIYGVEVFDVPFHEGFAGTLLDRNYGLIVSFPIFLLVLPGILHTLDRSQLRVNTVLFAVIAPYTLLSCTSTAWWGSYSPPARYPEVIVGLLSFYIAAVLQQVNRWFATCSAIVLALGAYALAVTSDIFPSERFTALDLRNHPMERLGHLVGVNFSHLAPSSFLPGQRGLFVGWWIAILAVGLLFWLAGNWPIRLRQHHATSLAAPGGESSTTRDRYLMSFQRYRDVLVGRGGVDTRSDSHAGKRVRWWIGVAVVLAASVLVVTAARGVLLGKGPDLQPTDVIGTWQSDEGGELIFASDGGFTATALRRDVVTPDRPGSTAERRADPRRSASGRWRLTGSDGGAAPPRNRVELTFAMIDGAAAGQTTRVRMADQGGSYTLFFFVVAPDLNIQYSFLKITD